MNLTEERITLQSGGRTLEGVIGSLGERELEGILKLQHEIMRYTDDDTTFVPLEKWELEYIFNGGGQLYGCKADGILLAYAGLIKPEHREDSLGYDLGLPHGDLNYVSHLETAVVHPRVRGNNLQFVLAGKLIEQVKKSDDIHYVLNTVSPYNTPSVLTTLRLGLKIKKLKEKYNGRLRYICCLNLNEKHAGYNSLQTVGSKEIEKQIELIGRGYEGFCCSWKKNDLLIEYGV